MQLAKVRGFRSDTVKEILCIGLWHNAVLRCKRRDCTWDKPKKMAVINEYEGGEYQENQYTGCRFG